MPTKTREKKSSGGKASALQKPLQPSEELTAVVGSGPLPRAQVVSKIWEYIRSHFNELLGAKDAVKYIGRDRSASPAAGSHALHKKQADEIMKAAFEPREKS